VNDIVLVATATCLGIFTGFIMARIQRAPRLRLEFDREFLRKQVQLELIRIYELANGVDSEMCDETEHDASLVMPKKVN
jgi:hypothetical protein